jgi:hypothetical protein
MWTDCAQKGVTHKGSAKPARPRAIRDTATDELADQHAGELLLFAVQLATRSYGDPFGEGAWSSSLDQA